CYSISLLHRGCPYLAAMGLHGSWRRFVIHAVTHTPPNKKSPACTGLLFGRPFMQNGPTFHTLHDFILSLTNTKSAAYGYRHQKRNKQIKNQATADEHEKAKPKRIRGAQVLWNTAIEQRRRGNPKAPAR
ncbi:MAG: hypothetical protein KDD54_15145, partial [Flavobacteriales bacterium]|nr:hypothetical protein [Flavobacteriales bacterium]